MKNVVILLGHKKQTGKDTVATELQKHISDLECFHFADKLKEIAKDLYSLSDEQLHGNLKEVEDKRYPNIYDAPYILSKKTDMWIKNPEYSEFFTPRRILQIVGQQQRALFPNVWAEYVFTQIANKRGGCYVIPDFRFRNEYAVAKKWQESNSENKLIVFRIDRPSIIQDSTDISENDLNDFDCWDFNIAASHSKWVGEGPQRMREALSRISKGSHLVVRIDEYDRAIGSTSGSGQGMHEAHKQVEAEFMNWLQNSQEENFLVNNDIFLVLTTNHKENITGPLMRSGRADLVIDISDFDEDSMRRAFLSAPRRMKNR